MAVLALFSTRMGDLANVVGEWSNGVDYHSSLYQCTPGQMCVATDQKNSIMSGAIKDSFTHSILSRLEEASMLAVM